MGRSDTFEIERRFLARIEDDAALRAAGHGGRIRQGYLTEAGPAVRVRERDGRWTLGVKAGDGRVRREVEVPVDAPAAEALFDIAAHRVIDKVRHVAGRWEVDVFAGKLEGLVVAEIELDDPDEELPPPPPGVRLLREVTDERGLTNQRLAAMGEAEAEALVRRLIGG